MITRTIAAVVTLLGVLGCWAGAASAQVDAGEALIVDANDPSVLVERGGSATVFTLRLPQDASCPGDSAHDGYRVQTFIVPAGDDLADVTFESTKPVGEGRWGLYQPNTRPFVQGLTEMNVGPGEPGRIGGLPPFTFAIYPPGLFDDGEYRIGVACTLHNEPERHWHTRIVLTNDVEDQPAQIRWRSGAAPITDERGSSGAVRVVLAAVAVAAAALALRLRRAVRGSASDIPQEQR